MKMTIKHENEVFLVISLKHVSGLKAIVNLPRTPKLWAKDHENGHITRKRRVSGHISQTCKGSYEACKSSENQNYVGKTHENDHKTRKRRVFGHDSETCKGFYEACKSAYNPKTVGTTHENAHKPR